MAEPGGSAAEAGGGRSGTGPSGVDAGHAGRILASGGAAMASQLARVVVTFGTQFLLRRLVPLDDWGLWSWADSVFLFLIAIRDLGMSAQVLRIQPRPYGPLLAVQAGFGLALTLSTLLAAPLLAAIRHDPNPAAVPVLGALSLFILLEGLGRVARTYFEAELQLRRTLLPEVLRNLCYSGTALALAATGHGLWSLVVAQLGSAALFAALLWARAWGRIPLAWVPGKTLELVRGGLPIGLIWLCVLASTYIDPLILGARFADPTVASYSFALQVAFLALVTVLEPIGRVLYPALLDLRRDPARQFEAYRLATLLLYALVAPAAGFLFVNAELVLLVLGGGQWQGAAPFLRVLCFAPLADPFLVFAGDVLLVHHRERTWLGAAALTASWLVAAGSVLTGAVGPVGMALVHLLPLGSLVMARALRGLAGAAFDGLLRSLAAVYLIPLPFFAAAWWLGEAEPLRLLLSAAALAATAVLYARRFGADFRRFFARAAAGEGGGAG